MDKYVVAVSGGVDSVALLYMLVNNVLPTNYHLPTTNYQLIVAHFDHGIRPESHKDNEFVESLANRYRLQFESRREDLGEKASEELARDRRYEFLREVAKKYDAKIITAHHADDVIESIAINISRGTGWRGLAVMGSDIIRPLVDMTKDEILAYAKQHNLQWRDDHTNFSDDYLRNQIRRKTSLIDPDTQRQLLALWSNQIYLREQIDEEVNRIMNGSGHERYFFISIDNPEALECLRQITKGLLTRPQLVQTLIAIKTFPAGKQCQSGSGVAINFTTRNFTVELLK